MAVAVLAAASVVLTVSFTASRFLCRIRRKLRLDNLIRTVTRLPPGADLAPAPNRITRRFPRVRMLRRDLSV